MTPPTQPTGVLLWLFETHALNRRDPSQARAYEAYRALQDRLTRDERRALLRVWRRFVDGVDMGSRTEMRKLVSGIRGKR